MIRQGELQVGDWVTGPFPAAGGGDSRRHGPISDVRPYRCSRHLLHPGELLSKPVYCNPDACERSRWHVVRYHDGTEVTLTEAGWPNLTIAHRDAPVT